MTRGVISFSKLVTQTSLMVQGEKNVDRKFEISDQLIHKFGMLNWAYQLWSLFAPFRVEVSKRVDVQKDVLDVRMNLG